jgi:mannosyltransferase
MPSTHQERALRGPRGSFRAVTTATEHLGYLSAWWVLFAAMLLGTVLRLYQLEALDLAYDESATGYFSALPWSDLWGPPAVLETNPPLYYSLAWLVHRCGGTLEQIRYVSALAGVLCIPAAWALANRLAGRFAAAAAALLVATSASQIASSQLARGYSLLALAVLVALLCLVAVRQPSVGGSPSRVRIAAWWAGYVAAALVALYTHNTAPVILAACNVTVLAGVVFDRRAAWPFLRALLAANVAVGLVYLFWVPVVLYQATHGPSISWIPRPGITEFRYQLMRVYGQRFIAAGQPIVDLLFLAAMIYGAWYYRSSRLVLALAAGVIAGGPLLMFVVSQWVPLIHAETLLWAGPVGLIFVALGCSALGWARMWVLALLVALQLGGDASAIRSHTDDWQQAVALIRANLRPGDTIFVAGPGTALLLAHYGLPEQSLDTRAIANGEAPWYRNFPGKVVAPDAVAAQALPLPRVWLVSRFWSAQHDAIARQIAGRSPLLLHYQSPGQGKGLEISLFDRTDN